MPYILISGTNTDAQIKHVGIHAEVIFAEGARLEHFKLITLKTELEAVLKKYYDGVESEFYSDKEFNEKIIPYDLQLISQQQ